MKKHIFDKHHFVACRTRWFCKRELAQTHEMQRQCSHTTFSQPWKTRLSSTHRCTLVCNKAFGYKMLVCNKASNVFVVDAHFEFSALCADILLKVLNGFVVSSQHPFLHMPPPPPPSPTGNTTTKSAFCSVDAD